MAAYAQDADPDATGSFSEQKVKPSSVKFSELDLSSGGASESKSFTVTDSGTESLTVMVGNPSGPEFTITQGAGQTALQPKGVLTVMVKFEPSAAGKFKGTIAVSSEATKGKTMSLVKLAGAAKGTASAGNSIFVTNQAVGSAPDSVTSYPLTGQGNIRPTVNINGSNPSLSQPTGIAFDSKGNIYVANKTGGVSGNGSVTEYAAGSNGNAMPIATISGPDTGLSDPQGIALDAGGNIYVANSIGGPAVASGGEGSITEYTAGSNGDTPPIATIYNTVFPGMADPTGIAVDRVSGNIFVGTGGGGFSSGLGSNVVEYAAGSNGAATPIAIIAGSNTGLGADEFTGTLIYGLALNPVNGDIYVVGEGLSGEGGIVLVYAAGTNGNMEPKAIIEGGLTFPSGVALDPSGTIYVVNSYFQSILVFAAGTNGNAMPIATITGSKTLLTFPYGIAVGP
jgi:hypothetical protein